MRNERITPQQLKELWKKIGNRKGHLRISTTSPLEWYVGYEDNGVPVLMILANAEPASFRSFKALNIIKGHRADERWTLRFQLTEPDQRQTFEKYIAHLVNSTLNAQTEAKALQQVYKEQQNWTRFLAFSTVNENRCKGLLGELLFLECLIPVYGPVISVEAWQGPQGADLDFVFSDSWYEIKTTGLASETIQISSLEQLSASSEGLLVVERLDKCSKQQAESVSLDKTMARILKLLAKEPYALSIFEENLDMFSHIEGSPEMTQTYSFGGRTAYAVNTSFPRLTPAAVSPAITAASYELNLAALTPWKAEIEWMH